jgi:hypothetical protein
MGITHEGVIANGEAPNEEFYSKLLNNNFEDLTEKELIAVKFAQCNGRRILSNYLKMKIFGLS